jgi:hypothetical protein
MPAKLVSRALLAVVLAALPCLALAQGSQAGDNGRQPVGADNEGPRQAIPNATTNDGWYGYGGSPYYEPSYERRYYIPGTRTYYVPPPYPVSPAYSYYASPYYGPIYYGPLYGPTHYEPDWGHALAYCDSQPLADRPACRDAIYAGRF